MRSLQTPILPSPYMQPDLIAPKQAWLISGSAYAATTWPVANQALYQPIVFPADCTLFALYALGNNATGNYDLGFYGPDLGKLASTGSTALAAAKLTLTLPELRVRGGSVYHAALVCSSTSSSIFCMGLGSVVDIRTALTNTAVQATALPLPSTMVPAAPANDFIPLFTFGIR